MDIALVEHAEHDIDGEQRRERSAPARCLSDGWKTCAVPWKVPWIVAGTPRRRIASSTARVASLSDTPGARLNEIVDGDEQTLVIDRERRRCPGRSG